MLALKMLRIPPTTVLRTPSLFIRSMQMKSQRPWSAHKINSPLASKPTPPPINSNPTSPSNPDINLKQSPLQRRLRKLKPKKAAITISPLAVEKLKILSDQPTPQFIRIGVKNRGCSGLSYNLEYVEKPGKFDDQVVQDGVKVLIDSNALFSVIGSVMDWEESKLASRFVFTNPNSKGSCGCGESFMV